MTLIDYPGKIAATVFTVGCNFRCPFCHNPELVLSTQLSVHSKSQNEEQVKSFFEFLKTRQGKLDGICITGGEPTLQPDLVEFITRIKKMGFAVKLDSNGTRPDTLKELFDKRLVDYVAMDIKASLENYEKVCGIMPLLTDFSSPAHENSDLNLTQKAQRYSDIASPSSPSSKSEFSTTYKKQSTKRGILDLERIKLSVGLIKNSGVDYEFRTTIVPGLHTEEEFKKVAEWLNGSRRYVLQKYEDYGKILDNSLRDKIKGKEIDLDKIKKMFEGKVDEVLVR